MAPWTGLTRWPPCQRLAPPFATEAHAVGTVERGDASETGWPTGLRAPEPAAETDSESEEDLVVVTDPEDGC